MGFREWIESLKAEQSPKAPAQPNKYEKAQAEEWRVPSHRGTEIAVDLALQDVGGFTCSGCHMSFLGVPKVLCVDSKGSAYDAKCSACFRVRLDAAHGKGW
jgi:hypothetical protein